MSFRIPTPSQNAVQSFDSSVRPTNSNYLNSSTTRRRQRSQQDFGIGSQCDDAKFLTPVYRPIHSLTKAYAPAFKTYSVIWWLHIISFIGRLLSGSGIIALGIILKEKNLIKGENRPQNVIDFYYQIEQWQFAVSLISGCVIFASGSLGAWVFALICNKNKRVELYCYETIGVRISLLMSIFYLPFTLLYYSILQDGFCSKTPIFKEASSSICQGSSYVLIGTLLSVIATISGALIICLWLGKTFLLYTILAFIRYSTGVFIWVITLDLTLHLMMVEFDTIGFNSLVEDGKYQFFLMGKIIRAHGFTAGVLNFIASAYSVCVCYYRSGVLLGIDMIVAFVVFWIEGALIVGWSWVYAIVAYLKNYKTLYGVSNDALDALFVSSFVSRIKQACICSAIYLIAVVVGFSAAFFAVFIPRCTPLEWSAPERLASRATGGSILLTRPTRQQIFSRRNDEVHDAAR